jgi:hypothetical protein
MKNKYTCTPTTLGCSLDDMNAGGNWTPIGAQHINYLEMLAVLFALKSFSSQVSGKHVKVLMDNTTAVAGINQMGTCLAVQITDLLAAYGNGVSLTIFG